MPKFKGVVFGQSLFIYKYFNRKRVNDVRTLRFIVDGQVIKQDPNCDFDNLVPGTDGYLQASFRFSPEWRNMNKVAAFWSVMGKEYPPRALDGSGICEIPPEALKRRSFLVQIIGKGVNSEKLTTNKITVCQNGGKA